MSHAKMSGSPWHDQHMCRFGRNSCSVAKEQPVISETPHTPRWNLPMRDCGLVNGSCRERFRLYARAKNQPGEAMSMKPKTPASSPLEHSFAPTRRSEPPSCSSSATFMTTVHSEATMSQPVFQRSMLAGKRRNLRLDAAVHSTIRQHTVDTVER